MATESLLVRLVALLIVSPGLCACEAGQRPAARPAAAKTCNPTISALPLLGRPGDSPLLPITVAGADAAIFFSPGFGPTMLRDNGSLRFPREETTQIVEPDGNAVDVDRSYLRGVKIGALPIEDRRAFRQWDPTDATVDGRPIVGILGRGALPANAIITLDLPKETVQVAVPCDDTPPDPNAPGIPMGSEVLAVPVEIEGVPTEAVLDPDLPISIMPRALARKIGITDKALADDPPVLTLFSAVSLGRRHRVKRFDIGDVEVRNMPFDIEEKARVPLIGLNFFSFGRSTFNFQNGRFLFQPTIETVTPPTKLHFDRTRLAHVSVGE
ncbi:retroviral-like aspartic protease family protein [Acetobacteraceae bacterium KSS8]|uniref:Retroviral-like aspartic protease family protein n=1 Tax=Endosaccharibacter trunci TaxID=2812733 RepID=A0ABT1WE06_9PROT|nr:retroviral-like aspartic protease family protein [Acetobacteraceae bacterium KSS8]